MSQISCENLTLGYEGRIIIEDLNLKIEKGQYVCVIGENGSGKSTLMKTILGLRQPLSGTITFGEGLVQKEIGYLPQQTGLQKDFPATVMEVVLSGCQNSLGKRCFYGAAEKEKARAVINRLGIEGLQRKSYSDLSGGQQQKVLLARALCATKKMLILDEPVTGLDIMSANEMYGLIEEINKNSEITIIMISHDIHDAVKYATNILSIGKKYFFGTKEEYLDSEMWHDIETKI